MTKPMPRTHRDIAMAALERAARHLAQSAASPVDRGAATLTASRFHAVLAVAAALSRDPGEQRRLGTIAKMRPPKPSRHVAVVKNPDQLGPAMKQFLSSTNNKKSAVSLDMEADSDVLLIAFGGRAGHMGIPPFEFFRVLSGFDVKKAYIRDLRQAWYHHGIPGVGETIEDIAERIQSLIDVSGAGRVVLAGNSAGGYAALLFGALVQVDEIVSIAPQTHIGVSYLEVIGDRRWLEHISTANGRRPFEDPYVDVREVLVISPNRASTRIAVHYSERSPLDAHHAERLSDVAGVDFVRYPTSTHSLIRLLRDNGDLSEILTAATSRDVAAQL
jgi:pimeloyl-ACP methyl ester carboxylesterase